ncbi:hypothetical protein JR316_0007898 [Psilocybe cubensis]|uniref:F-box domain-containing protein n=2 Tax=Psilocybe cubensis TaxID=181762 RepID=A0A8H8CI39_PSICU|nr:hypothetical protein JR316_0007898 [Psilocybe cubensis]KAH9479309.1 hypothetical protein JR316_0007898 [Psilocybe cubensis]
MDLDATTSTILSFESDESMRGSVSQTVDLNFHTRSQMSEQQVRCARSISAQAEVLGNEDLLGVIFASAQPVLVNVEETMPSSWAARDILRIALTCKNFYEPAISVLWRSMISWAPLLRLIPSVVQREGIFTTDSPIMVEDLSRFNFYAKQIQHFNLTPKHAKGKNSLPVSSHLGALLAHHRRLENILFPVLQTLTIDMSSMLPGGIPILFLLPPAALKDIRLKWTNPFDRHVASSFINVLSQLSPALSCLHLEGYLADGTLDVRRVHDFKQLREVSLKLSPEGQNMTAIPDLWSQLTNLQHLTTLCLSLPGSEYLGQFYVPCVFNSLDTFNIKGPMDSVVVILRLIKVSHLLNFNLTLDEASLAGLSRMKTLLPASLASLSIHSVCVDAIINFSPDIQSIDIVSVCAASIIPNAFFAKFSSISRLRKLSICLEVINFLFVESLHSAKWKWPNL